MYLRQGIFWWSRMLTISEWGWDQVHTWSISRKYVGTTLIQKNQKGKKKRLISLPCWSGKKKNKILQCVSVFFFFWRSRCELISVVKDDSCGKREKKNDKDARKWEKRGRKGRMMTGCRILPTHTCNCHTVQFIFRLQSKSAEEHP